MVMLLLLLMMVLPADGEVDDWYPADGDAPMVMMMVHVLLFLLLFSSF
jgi:hypothetical protein